jgi:hypothetical protein
VPADDTFGDDTVADDAAADDTFGDDTFGDDTFGDDTAADDAAADDTAADDTAVWSSRQDSNTPVVELGANGVCELRGVWGCRAGQPQTRHVGA